MPLCKDNDNTRCSSVSKEQTTGLDSFEFLVNAALIRVLFGLDIVEVIFELVRGDFLIGDWIRIGHLTLDVF